MAISLKVTKCIKGHPLWIRNGIDYFCNKCGEIDIVELRWQIYRKIQKLRRSRKN